MDTNALDSLVETVIGAAYEVSNVLGCGFLEKVYGRALFLELTRRGLNARTQVVFPIDFRGHCVGEYTADLVVGDRVIVELKCVDAFTNQHLAQCINYLKASGLTLALLINFQKPKVEWRRIVYSRAFAAKFSSSGSTAGQPSRPG
jgi:GxxExxY protein